MENKSIFDEINTEIERKILLKELQAELSGYSSKNTEHYGNGNSFQFNEPMLQAEFYHLCKIYNIPCYLEISVFTDGDSGIVDAIIFIQNRKVIIEFKMLKEKETIKKYTRQKQRKEQLIKYLTCKLPVLLITNKCSLIDIVQYINKINFFNKVYYFNQDVKEFKILF